MRNKMSLSRVTRSEDGSSNFQVSFKIKDEQDFCSVKCQMAFHLKQEVMNRVNYADCIHPAVTLRG